MMKTLQSILLTLTNVIWWGGVFLACRIAVWLAAKPAWWTVPVALAVGTAWLGARALAHERGLRRSGRFSAAGPELRQRMAEAWRRGRPLLSGGFFRPNPPILLFLDLTRGAAASTLELADAADRDTASHSDEFTWHRGPDAVWLDYHNPLTRDDAGRWQLFVETSRRTRFDGVTVTLDAAKLASDGLSGANDLRQRLESLQDAQEHPLPVYLILDNVDRLYGLRSLVSRLSPDGLAAPFGGFRNQALENSPAFFRRILAEGVAALELGGADGASLGAAAVLAPEELARLEAPLTRFCRQVFLRGSRERAGKAAWIRGLFLAASAPGGATVAPELARLPAFKPLHETLPVQPWFLRSLLRDAIPADAPEARLASASGLRRLFPAHAGGALAAAAAFSLLLTWSFMENRSILLSARGRAVPPVEAAELQPYLDLATATRLRARGWTLPRFGMNEAEDLAQELSRRFTESYFDLKTIPSIEHVQDAAIAAAESGDPGEIGNALLLLAVTRDGIARNLDGARADNAGTALLHALVNAQRLATPEDMRQLETYFTWAGRQEWMPETAKTLEEFEQYLVDNAAGGNLSWLPEWVGSLPGLQPVDTSLVWSVPLADNSLSVVGPAWTREGYAIAKGILDAVAHGEDNGSWRERREQFLAQYRLQAVERWRVAAAVLWSKFRRRIPDGEVHALMRQAIRGDDPASRFAELARHHLLPMFENTVAADSPDIAWLLLHEKLDLASRRRPERGSGSGLERLADRLVTAVHDLGSDEKLDKLSVKFGLSSGNDDAEARLTGERWLDALRRFGLAAESSEENFAVIRGHFHSWQNRLADTSAFDPLLQAGKEAELLHRHLRENTGSGAWDGLSPLAAYDYIRYLATRRAALHLDAMWREQVFNPSHLVASGEGERLEHLSASGGALEQFLTKTASGFWYWDGEGLANAEWRRLPFMFDGDFLEFCRKSLRDKRPARPERLELPFQVKAVDVAEGALERPIRVEFVLRSGGGEQTVIFNNFRIAEDLVWHMDADAALTMRVVFPSVTATVDFTGKAGLRTFASMMSMGEAQFGAESFSEAEATLRRLGVDRIVVKARLDKADAFMRHLRGEAFSLPRSVIVAGPTGTGATAPKAAYGPY